MRLIRNVLASRATLTFHVMYYSFQIAQMLYLI
jgi:hypothetical protein